MNAIFIKNNSKLAKLIEKKGLPKSSENHEFWEKYVDDYIIERYYEQIPNFTRL